MSDMSEATTRRTSKVPEIRDQIRESILSGDLAPDAPLSSVQLAKRFDVSRTPLREALRLLQEEGLVTMADNHRARVAPTSPDDLDAVYAQRIVLSALCTSLSLIDVKPCEVETMRTAFDQMRSAHESGSIDSWRDGNATFHRAQMANAPAGLMAEVTRLQQRCAYFYTLWAANHPNERHLTIEDHHRILDSCVAGDTDGAAEGMALHLHRIGTTLYRDVSSETTPVAMDEALAQVAGDAVVGRG
ncbi:MAG: GntR family transcriptional regulator [Ilumatobacter sp.]